MADEQKTILTIDGDASGAKKAAQEAKAAVQEVGQAAPTSTSAGTNDATVALQSQTVAAKEATDAVKGTADAMAIGESDAAAFAETLSQVSPELGMLTQLGIKAQSVFKFLFSPIGLAAAAAVAAVGLAVAAVNKLLETAKEAEAQFDRIIEKNNKLRRGSEDQYDSVADVMAKAGVNDDTAVQNAQNLEKKFTEQGFKAESIRAVLPYAIDASGNQVMSDDEIAQLAAADEFGTADLAFSGPKDMKRKLAGAQRQVGRDQGTNDAQVTAIRKRQTREQQRLASGNRDRIIDKIIEEDQLSQEEAAKAADDVLAIRGGGDVSTEGYSYDWEQDRMMWQQRQREAADRAKRFGLISGKQSQASQDRTLQQSRWENNRGSEFLWKPLSSTIRLGAEAAAGAADAVVEGAQAMAGSAQQPAPQPQATVIQNHGTINMQTTAPKPAAPMQTP